MLHKTPLNRYLYFFSICLFVLLLIPRTFFNYPTAGLDASWAVALNLAYKYKLVFGRDFEFTYGPLGVVRSRLPFGVSWLMYLLFDGYLLATQLLVIRRILSRHFQLGVVLFLLLALFFSAREETGSWFFFLSAFYLLSMLRGPVRWTDGLQAALLAVLTFYFKASVGVVAMALYLAVLVYLLIRRRIDARLFAMLLAGLVACVALGAWWLRVDLKGYTLGGLYLISGYNDAMFLPITGDGVPLLRISISMLAGTALFCLASLLTLIRERRLLKDPDDLIVYGVITFMVFFYYKSGFTRADRQHISQFFRGAVLFIGLIYFFGRNSRPWKLLSASWCWVIIGGSMIAASLYPDGSRPLQRLATLSFVPERLNDVGNYFSQLFHYKEEAKAEENRVAAPNPLRDRIGNASADIIPWEISTLYFNGIRYNPRPVMQTYSAYNTWLDSLNAAKYASPDGPQFVLFSRGGTDQRLPWFDEARTKLELLNRYTVAGRVKDDLLLQRRPSPILQRAGSDTLQALLGREIPIPHYDGLRFTRFFIRYSRMGRLQRMVYQTPRLNIVVTLDNGDRFTYKAPKPILEDGVIINQFEDSEEEFQALLQGYGRMTPEIRSIRIVPDGTDSCFGPEVTMTNAYYRFAPPVEQRTADSTGLAALLHRCAPGSLNLTQVRTDSVTSSLEVLRHDPRFIIARGWAYRPGGDNSKDTPTVILESRDHIYELSTTTIASPDMIDVLGRKDVGNIRFNSVIATQNIAPGHYAVGIGNRDPNGGERRVEFTGQFVLVRTNHTVERLHAMPGPSPEKNSATQGSTVLWSIDSARIRNGRIAIDGWAHWQGAGPSPTTGILFRSGSDVYRVVADLIQRNDVAQQRNDPAFRYSGFTLDLAADSLPNDRYDLGIGITGAHGEQKIVFTDRQLTVNSFGVASPARVRSTLPADTLFAGWIDSLQDEKESFTIRGWGVYKPAEMKKDVLQVVLSNDSVIYTSEVRPEHRSDITASFHHRFDLDNCGFATRIMKNALLPGRYRVGILVRRPGGRAGLRFFDRYVVKQ